MANIYHIYIDIYDTTLPEWEKIPLEDAERFSCKLVYEGEDDKFQAIMASRLDFTLEVDIENSTQELFYDNLFTGDELRWKAVIYNQDDEELWQGFVLPDEYTEPYTTGTFYVRFSATDNLGTLKGKYLPSTFFRSKQSFIKIIADCLKQTGLTLPLYVAPSVYNSVAFGRYDKLFLDGALWFENDKKVNTYQILEDVLDGMGCTLWQQEGYWWIVGAHAKGVGNYTKNEYDADGVFVDSGYQIVRKPLYLDWYASPQVALKPPFKEISIVSGVEQSASVFPEDIVKQPWVKTSDTQDDPFTPLSKYWTGTGLEPVITNKGGYPVEDYNTTDINVEGIVSAFKIYTNPSSAQKLANFISLKQPVYVKGGTGVSLYVKLVLTSPWPVGASGPPEIVDHVYQYEILLDGITIISNKEGYADRGAWPLVYSVSETGYESSTGTSFANIDATIEIDYFTLSSSGFLDVRVFHLGGGYPVQAVGVKELEVKYVYPEENTFTKTRGINRTNTLERTLVFGDSVIDAAQNAIVYQDNIPSEYMTRILFQRFNDLIVGSDYYKRIYHFNTSNYAVLQANINSLYVKKVNSDYYQYVKDVTDLGAVGPYNLVAMNLFGEDDIDIADALYWRSSVSGDPNTAIMHAVREQWNKATNATSQQRYGAILSEVLHDQYNEPLVVMEGSSKGIVFPDTYIGYEFKSKYRKWVPARIEIAFGENETRLTAIEFKNEKVTDYV